MRFGRKGEDKLYEQWVKHGDLTPDAVPQRESRAIPPKESRDVPSRETRESPEDVPVSRERTGRRSPVLYVLLVIGICMLCVGLVLILTQS